jgi:ribonuclease HI
MTFKTIIDYFEQTSYSPEKTLNRKKPLGLLIKTVDHELESNEPVSAFLKNFSMPKKKIIPQHVDHPVMNFNKSEIANKEPLLVKNKEPLVVKKEEPIPPQKFEGVRIYTDGSCILNGKPNARGGWAVYFPGGQFMNSAQKYTNHPTNQRCELTAIQQALEITRSYIEGGGKVEIYTDSEYCLKCLQEYCKKWSLNGWLKADKRPVENRDIIEPLYKFYSMYWRQIIMKHVRAHTGRQDEHSKANDIVDQMARSTIF